MDPRNGILMGVWVGTEHDSMTDIAAASLAMSLDDAAKEREAKEQAASQQDGTFNAGNLPSGGTGWNK